MNLCTDAEAMQAIATLESSFKNAKYSEVQLKLIFSAFKQLTQAEARKVIEWHAAQTITPPTPNKIQESVRLMEHKRPSRQVVKEYPAREVDCILCYETGFNFVSVDEVTTLCRCICRYGRKADQSFPVFNESMKRFKFPVERFKPKDGVVSSREGAKIIEWWNSTKEIAGLFWNSRDKGA